MKIFDSDDTPTKLTATASFSNGSTWAAEFNFKAFKSRDKKYVDHNAWLSCANGESQQEMMLSRCFTSFIS